MFPLPILEWVKIGVLVIACLFTGYVTHKVDESSHQKQIIAQQQQAIEHETKVVNDQAAVTQKTQKDKDDLQNKYDIAIAQLRGLRQQSSTPGNKPTAPAISSQGLRLLESDAEILIGFARQCETSEIERNDVIQKYNSLMVK
jgi:hypothetical protein